MVREVWDRIESWCRANHPQLLQTLNTGASAQEIAALETAIGQPFPEDLVASLSIHNGQAEGSSCQFLFDSLTLSGCEQIHSIHALWGSGLGDAPDYFRYHPENAIARQCFHEGWIPIADEEAGLNYLAIDLAPGTAGTVGQVIDFGRNISEPGVLASSWGQFLHSYADLLDTLTEKGAPADNYVDTFHQLFSMNCLDSLVLWARDGRWPIVRFRPSWRTSTVMSLAKAISNTRDFSAMPILADALQDAGCESDAVLNHCRDQGCEHANGCWVIDTLLSGTVTTARWCHEYGR
jgi:cell wall assembly regulator SMI1